MSTISRLSVSLTASTKGFQQGLKKAQTQFGKFKSSITSAPALIGAGLAGIGIGSFVGDLVSTNEKFQQLKSTLTTLTGSSGAGNAAFKQIEKFALNTPFNLDEVVSSFIKLKALGLDPSESALTSYGNTASAMGKSLNQMIEAVADASTGEFERLKEFGIKAKSEGDKVTFTFQGIATTVGKNAAEIEGYLRGIGDNTFGTAMSDQMKNLTPAFSNFNAAIDSLQRQIGEAGLNDMIRDSTIAMTEFVNSVDASKVAGFLTDIRDAFTWISNTTDTATDFMSGILADHHVDRILGEGIASGHFQEQLTNASREAFNKALETGTSVSSNLPGGTPDRTFDEWAREIRGEDNPQIDKTNELLGTLIRQNRGQVGAVAG